MISYRVCYQFIYEYVNIYVVVLLSITITAKNEAPVISKVLNNIINQLKDIDYEMVLVDNWSTDNTFEILEKYKSDNVRVFRYKGSKGNARNFALKKAEGKYVLALDADQIYHNLNKFLEDYFSSYSNYSVKIGRSSFPIIAPRNLLIEVGGWRNLQFAEDWDLWFRLADECKYIYLTGYDWVFGEHLRQHKNNPNVAKRLLRNIIKYRDLYIVGLPVNSFNLSSKFFYQFGKFLSIFSKEKRTKYNCIKYIEIPIFQGSIIDWDLQFHYNLIKYQLMACNNKEIFLRTLLQFDSYLKNIYNL